MQFWHLRTDVYACFTLYHVVPLCYTYNHIGTLLNSGTLLHDQWHVWHFTMLPHLTNLGLCCNIVPHFLIFWYFVVILLDFLIFCHFMHWCVCMFCTLPRCTTLLYNHIGNLLNSSTLLYDQWHVWNFIILPHLTDLGLCFNIVTLSYILALCCIIMGLSCILGLCCNNGTL